MVHRSVVWLAFCNPEERSVVVVLLSKKDLCSGRFVVHVIQKRVVWSLVLTRTMRCVVVVSSNGELCGCRCVVLKSDVWSSFFVQQDLKESCVFVNLSSKKDRCVVVILSSKKTVVRGLSSKKRIVVFV